MAGKGKFTIPSAKEMEEGAIQTKKPMSLFANYKQQKTIEDVSNKQASSNTSMKNSTRENLHPAAGAKRMGSSKPDVPGNSSVMKKTNNATNANKEPEPSSSSTMVSTVDKSSVEQELPTAAGKAASSNSIIVNYRQRGNPILKHIRNVTWEYGSIVPDYVMGKANCALYLSLRYHQLNPAYIHNRLKELGRGYDLRVILVQVDVKEPHHLLKDLAKMCILADCTLMLAFSTEEAGRYLETYKVYENKPVEALMEKTDNDYISKLTEALTSVKSVNKTDSMTLLSSFKSMKGVINASKEDLSLCPGFGPQKAQRLHDVFQEPFMKGRKRKHIAEKGGGSGAASPSKAAVS